MTSRHGSDSGRRGIAPWIIVTAVTVLLVAAATVAYVFIVRQTDDSAKAPCSAQVALPVVASPGAAAALTAAGASFTATGPVARSACVQTTVTEMDGSTAAKALADGWKGQAGAAPGVWVPDSATDLTTLEASDSALTAGRDTRPLATSPVVLAVRSDDAAAVTAAGLSWQQLPTQVGKGGSVTLPSGRQLIVALPDPATNRGTSYALQSVVAARNGGKVDPAAVAATAKDLQAIGAGGPATQPATTQDALNQLKAGKAGFEAVPVVASDLATFTAANPGLTAISPTGPAVGDAVYPVPLTASWVTPAMEDAAALFAAYLRTPAGTAAFTDNGLTVAAAGQTSSSVPASPSTSSPTAGNTGAATLPDAGQQVTDAIAAAVGG